MNRRNFSIRKGARRIFKHYSDIVITILPCIIIVSFVGVILNILTEMPLFHGRPASEVWEAAAGWGAFLQILSNCGILSIPVYITWSAVRHFGGTELYGIFVGLALVPYGVLSGMEMSTALEQGELAYWNLGIMEIPQAGFQGQMLAAILAGLLVTVIEKWLTKRIPPAAYTFVVPFACVVCTVIAVYLLVGSAARIVEQGLVRAVNFILGDEAMKAAGGFVMGVITVPLMALGIHLALVPVQLQQIAAGESALWPIQVSSVLACGGAALAIFLLSKKEEEIHGPAREGVLITLGLGTVEPALFGVCCRRKEAMAGAVIASGLAGLVGRLTDCYSTSFGVNGFFSFLNLPMEKWVQYALMLGVSVIGSLTLTLLFASMRKR